MHSITTTFSPRPSQALRHKSAQPGGPSVATPPGRTATAPALRPSTGEPDRVQRHQLSITPSPADDSLETRLYSAYRTFRDTGNGRELADLMLKNRRQPAVARWADHYDLLATAVKEKSTPLFTACVMSGVNLDKKDQNGYAPIHLAILKGNHDYLNHLLKNGADPNKECGSVWRMSQNVDHLSEVNGPLHIAAKKDDLNAVRLLLLNGARLDQPNMNGLEAIDMAGPKATDYIFKARLFLQLEHCTTAGVRYDRIFQLKSVFLKKAHALLTKSEIRGLTKSQQLENRFLHKPLDVPDNGKYIKNGMNALKPGEFLLFNTGYPGHAIGVLARRNQNQELEVSIFNRIQGNPRHPLGKGQLYYPYTFRLDTSGSADPGRLEADFTKGFARAIAVTYRESQTASPFFPFDSDAFYRLFDATAQKINHEEGLAHKVITTNREDGLGEDPQYVDNCVTLSLLSPLRHIINNDARYNRVIHRYRNGLLNDLNGGSASHIRELAKGLLENNQDKEWEAIATVGPQQFAKATTLKLSPEEKETALLKAAQFAYRTVHEWENGRARTLSFIPEMNAMYRENKAVLAKLHELFKIKS